MLEGLAALVVLGRCAHLSLLWGRNQLKAAYLMSVETAQGLLNEIGSEALLSGTHTAPAVVAQKIDSVTSADVVNVSVSPHVFLNGCASS